MSYLRQYIQNRNKMAVFYRRPILDADNLSQKDVLALQASLEADLSPENLTCDGELRGKALQQKFRLLSGAQAELNEYKALN